MGYSLLLVSLILLTFFAIVITTFILARLRCRYMW
jgi:hypothetical protein